MKSREGDFLPAALLIILGLYGIVRLILDRRKHLSDTSKPVGTWQFIFSFGGRAGTVLLGVDLLFEYLNLAWKSISLGLVGLALLLGSLVYSTVSALSRAAAHVPEGTKGPAAGAWIAWVVLSPIGHTVGAVLPPIVFITLGHRISNLSPIAEYAIFGFSTGLFTGAAQWLVLRHHFTRSGLWIWATALGFVIAFSVQRVFLDAYGGLEAPVTILVMNRILRGALIAVPQWLVLRSWLATAGAWIPINSLASVAAYGASEWLVPEPVGGPFRDEGESLRELGRILKSYLIGGVARAVILATALLTLARKVKTAD